MWLCLSLWQHIYLNTHSILLPLETALILEVNIGSFLQMLSVETFSAENRVPIILVVCVHFSIQSYDQEFENVLMF